MCTHIFLNMYPHFSLSHQLPSLHIMYFCWENKECVHGSEVRQPVAGPWNIHSEVHWPPFRTTYPGTSRWEPWDWFVWGFGRQPDFTSPLRLGLFKSMQSLSTFWTILLRFIFLSPLKKTSVLHSSNTTDWPLSRQQVFRLWLPSGIGQQPSIHPVFLNLVPPRSMTTAVDHSRDTCSHSLAAPFFTLSNLPRGF